MADSDGDFETIVPFQQTFEDPDDDHGDSIRAKRRKNSWVDLLEIRAADLLLTCEREGLMIRPSEDARLSHVQVKFYLGSLRV